MYLIPVVFTGVSNYSFEDVAVIAIDMCLIGLMKHGLERE